MADVKGLAFKVLASVTGAASIDQLGQKVESVGKKASGLGDAFKLLGGALVLEKIKSYGEGLLEAGDQLTKLSQKTGISVETLAQFQVAGELADVSVEQLAKTLNKLSVNTVAAASGNQELKGTFKNLEIDIRSAGGGLKDSGEIVLELADRFKSMKDGSEKAAVATKLFGKAGYELIPFLDQGSAAIKQYALAIDDDFAKRSEVFNDSLKLIGLNAKNAALTGLKELLPTLQELATAFINFTKGENDPGAIITAIGETARVAAIGVATLASTFGSLGVSIGGFSAAIGQVARLNFKGAKEISDEGDRIIDERNAKLAKFISDLTKNSKVFGDGTSAAAAERAKKETAPETGAGKQKPSGDVTGENRKILAAFDERIAKIRAEASAVGDSNVQKQTAVLLAELESKGIDKSSKSYALYSQKIRAAITALEAAKEIQQSKDFVRKEKESFDLQTLQLANYSKSSAELQKLTVAKELDNQAAETTINFTKQGKAAYLQATEAVKAQRIALIDLQTEQKQSYGVGAKQALRDYLEAAKDVAAQTKAAFSQAFANIEDSLVEFVKTGKTSFKKLADDIIDQLIRISIKSAAVQAITGGQALFSNLFSSPSTVVTAGESTAFGPGLNVAAKGGIMTGKGMASLNTYSRGGIATRPQLAVFGEGSGPEAYVPLPDGRSIPVSMKGQGSSSSVSITVNMANGTSSARSSADDVRQFGQAIQNAVQAELVNQKRPGGYLA